MREDLLARPAVKFALAILVGLAAASAAQAGSSNSVEKGKSKGAAPTPPAGAPAAPAAAPEARVAGSYGNWTLLCGKEGDDKTAPERCSLVMPLIEKQSQKLVFRVIVTYGPKDNLILRVDSPTGIALQRGLEFSPDTQKIYRMAFQTCLPMGCKALLLMPDDLKKELSASKEGAITVYALNGKAVRTVTALTGFAEGMAALNKHHASP